MALCLLGVALIAIYK